MMKKRVLCFRIDEETIFRLWEVMNVHYPGIKKQAFLQMVIESFIRRATAPR